jgi:hypothetical protein
MALRIAGPSQRFVEVALQPQMRAFVGLDLQLSASAIDPHEEPCCLQAQTYNRGEHPDAMQNHYILNSDQHVSALTAAVSNNNDYDSE